MLGKRKWLTMTLLVALTTVGLGASAGADSGSEQGFLAAINSTRSGQGLAPLKMDGGLQSHARNHTQDMIAEGQIFHSSSGELKSAAGSGWTKLGENVGRGATVSGLHQAFLASPGHKANILGDYNYVGIGTDSQDGYLWVTVVFMKKGGGSPTPATTTTAAPTTTTPSKTTETTAPAKAPGTTADRPEPTTTTTTIPPSTTTTTLIVGPDKPVTPGESCIDATRFGWTCHD